MRYLPLVLILLPVSLRAQCSHTPYGQFTCVQTGIANSNSGAGPLPNRTFTLPASTTAGDQLLVIANYCLDSACATTGTRTPTVTDSAGDIGWQTCPSFNTPPPDINRYYLCWWLPNVGIATTVTVTVNPSYALTLWVAEFSGGCQTALSCFDSDSPPITCTTICGFPVTTYTPNDLVVAYARSNTGAFLTAQAPWLTLSSIAAGDIIGLPQSLAGTYTPSWSAPTGNLIRGPAMAILCGGCSRSSLITVPTMPVF